MNELLKRPADEFENAESLEEMWAEKAFEHAEIHFNVSNCWFAMVFVAMLFS